jgi:hypothetical protein
MEHETKEPSLVFDEEQSDELEVYIPEKEKG